MSLLFCSSDRTLNDYIFAFSPHRWSQACGTTVMALGFASAIFSLHLVITDTRAAFCFITLHFSFAAPAGWSLSGERFMSLF
jgi:hypothetical protein